MPVNGPEDHLVDGERSRRRLGSKELGEIDLSDLDLGLVELDVVEEPTFVMPPLFSHLAPEELHEVMKCMVARSFEQGAAVVRQGESGDSIFLVCDGKVRVRLRRMDGVEVDVAVLEEAAFFGEFGVFTDGRRHATVVADGSVELLEMRQADLLNVSRRHPRINDVLHRRYRERAVETALAFSKLFGDLDTASRIEIARMALEESHPAGHVIMQEGDETLGLYLVRRGSLLVRTENLSGEPLLLAELRPGDFFGEISALTGSPVTAEVVTAEPCDLLRLPPSSLLEVCERWPALREALESTRGRRLHETIERLGEAGAV